MSCQIREVASSVEHTNELIDETMFYPYGYIRTFLGCYIILTENSIPATNIIIITRLQCGTPKE